MISHLVDFSLNSTYEKLGPRGFHAFLFVSGVSDALVDILFRFTLFLGAIADSYSNVLGHS